MEDVPHFARNGYFGPELGKLLLCYGRPARVGEAPAQWRHLRGPKKQCFRNAAELALQHPDHLRYVEGYAFADIAIHLPLAHAWLETREGLVVDPTWQGGGAVILE